MRRAAFRIWRLLPPFTRSIAVKRISVGGFLELVRLVAPKVAAAILARPEKTLDDVGLIHAAADAEILAKAADLVCPDRPVGFLTGWLDGRLGGAFARTNTTRFLAACRAVEGDGQWTRFLGCLNRTPAEPAAGGKKWKAARAGGLMADVLTLARIFALPPAAVLAMDLRDFLDLCEALNLAAESGEPEERDEDEAVPIADLEGLGSGAVFH